MSFTPEDRSSLASRMKSAVAVDSRFPGDPE